MSVTKKKKKTLLVDWTWATYQNSGLGLRLAQIQGGLEGVRA